MRRTARLACLVTACLGAICTGHAAAQTAPPSPAEQRIGWARRTLDAKPDDPQGHIDLAQALARRARETGDAVFYAQADQALRPVLALDPSNFDARKVQVWILNGRRDFAPAREIATALNKQTPDDVLVYGLLADALVGLGDYKAAEDSVQWMLNMRPKSPYSQARTATLRELFGDDEGALDMLGAALTATVPAEVEDRAWILSQMGRLYVSSGHQKEAEAALQQALSIFPRYHYALAYLAELRVEQNQYQDAVDILKPLCAAVPRASNLYALAEALDRAKSPDTARAYAEFEQKALAESSAFDNANDELVAYYADHAKNPHEALRIAELEHGRRHDVYSQEAYAWALAQNGRYAEAKKEMDIALAVGIQDARMLYHAGVIAVKLHRQAEAAHHLQRSLEQNPQSRTAPAARALLRTLPPPTANTSAR